MARKTGRQLARENAAKARTGSEAVPKGMRRGPAAAPLTPREARAGWEAAKRNPSAWGGRDKGLKAIARGERTARGLAKSMARRGIDPSRGLMEPSDASVFGRGRVARPGMSETLGSTARRQRSASKMGKLARNVQSLGGISSVENVRGEASRNAVRKLVGKLGPAAKNVMAKVPKMPGTGVLDFVPKESITRGMKATERVVKKRRTIERASGRKQRGA